MVRPIGAHTPALRQCLDSAPCRAAPPQHSVNKLTVAVQREIFILAVAAEQAPGAGAVDRGLRDGI